MLSPTLIAVALSALFLGDKPSLPVLLTLLPIVGGVGLASVSEVRQGMAVGAHSLLHSRSVCSCCL